MRSPSNKRIRNIAGILRIKYYEQYIEGLSNIQSIIDSPTLTIFVVCTFPPHPSYIQLSHLDSSAPATPLASTAKQSPPIHPKMNLKFFPPNSFQAQLERKTSHSTHLKELTNLCRQLRSRGVGSFCVYTGRKCGNRKG
jgi:hypothetical protein